ncbi:SHOCT domain-containing protein [Streptomyces litchfieldiae]|uniref:SHOCT domain-containing protein n=1 Tax=Streptomyces litchfieldiae TaxID=3075543 RepID=A0ABU2MQT7_9ACTN|nr:SHOCT domain-containing protein [Streptomyces sp. DSM 44938]MDT0343767.1 SHOCT domain-containing protein [Streptomyces sp. DSM 44938]
METLAHTFRDDGPGPWILLFPLFWAVVLIGGGWLLRRTVWRGRGGPGHDTPVALLGRRFAAGEIDAEEYRGRLAVLTENRRGA